MRHYSYRGKYRGKPRRKPKHVVPELTDELIAGLPIKGSEYTVRERGTGMMVRVRPNGTKTFYHQSREHLAGSRPRSLGSTECLSIEGARALAYRYDVGIHIDGFGRKLSPQSTLAEAVKSYLDHLESERSESYHRKAKVAFLSRILPAFRCIRLPSLTLGKIDRYVGSRATASQQRNDRAFIGSLLTWLVDKGALEVNFMRGSYVPNASIVGRFSERDTRNGTEEALRILRPYDQIPEPIWTLLVLVALTGFPVLDFLSVLRASTSPGEPKLPSYTWSVRFPKVQLGPLARELQSMTGTVPPHLSGKTVNATLLRIAEDVARFAGDSHVRCTRCRKTIAKLVEEELIRLRFNLEDWEQYLRQILDERQAALDEIIL